MCRKWQRCSLLRTLKFIKKPYDQLETEKIITDPLAFNISTVVHLFNNFTITALGRLPVIEPADYYYYFYSRPEFRFCVVVRGGSPDIFFYRIR